MYRSIWMVLGVFLISLAACAPAQLQQVRTPAAESVDDEEVVAAEPARDSASQQAAPEDLDSQPGRSGEPIDLGMDDGAAGSKRPIVITRTNNTELGEPRQPTPAKVYEQKCRQVSDCRGLETPDCDGQMQCVSQRCVYMCTADEDDLDEDSEDEGSEDGDDF